MNLRLNCHSNLCMPPFFTRFFVVTDDVACSLYHMRFNESHSILYKKIGTKNLLFSANFLCVYVWKYPANINNVFTKWILMLFKTYMDAYVQYQFVWAKKKTCHFCKWLYLLKQRGKWSLILGVKKRMRYTNS